MGANREKAQRHRGGTMLAKKAANWRSAKRRNPARNQNPNGYTLEKLNAGE